jgi:hypothetical protein
LVGRQVGGFGVGQEVALSRLDDETPALLALWWWLSCRHGRSPRQAGQDRAARSVVKRERFRASSVPQVEQAATQWPWRRYRA